MVTYSCWLKSKKAQKKNSSRKRNWGVKHKTNGKEEQKCVYEKHGFLCRQKKKKVVPTLWKKNFLRRDPGRVFLINSPLILLKKGNFFAKPASQHSALNLEKCGFIFGSMITSNAKINHFSFTLFAPSWDTSIWRNLSKRRFLKSCKAF